MDEDAQNSTQKATKVLRGMRQLFVEAYLKLGDGTASALAAGYSKTGAAQAGSKLLRNPEVKSAIIEARRDIRERTTVDEAWLLSELADIAKTDLAELFDPETGDLLDLTAMTARARRMISGIEVRSIIRPDGTVRGHVRKVKLVDRVKVLELLGRHRAVDAWRQPEFNVNLPMLVVRNFTGRELEIDEPDGSDEPSKH